MAVGQINQDRPRLFLMAFSYHAAQIISLRRQCACVDENDLLLCADDA
jgi:hypothetical protein